MGALENAMMMMDAFDKFAPWGMQYKQRQQGLQQGQQQLQQGQQEMSARAETMDQAGLKGASDEQASQVQNIAGGLTPDTLNTGFTTPLPGGQNSMPDARPRFWHELDSGEKEHVKGHFIQNGVNEFGLGAVPQAYNAWVTQNYHVLPGVMMPMGLDTSGISVTGMKANEKGNVEPVFGWGGKWSPEQTSVLKQGPLAVAQSSLFNGVQREPAKVDSIEFQKNLQGYQDRVTSAPAIKSYIAGQGEQAGILPLWRDVDGMRQKHMDKTGNWVSDLTPQESNTLIYRLGRIDNPGAIVRQQEFETIAKNAGVYDSIVAGVGHAAAGKSKIPMAVAKDIYNVVDQLKNAAQQRFHEALASWEPEIAQHGLGLEDVVHDRPALQEFQRQYGPMTMDPSNDPAVAKLKPGEIYHAPGGQRFIVGGASEGEGNSKPQTPSSKKTSSASPQASKEQPLSALPNVTLPSAATPTTVPSTNEPKMVEDMHGNLVPAGNGFNLPDFWKSLLQPVTNGASPLPNAAAITNKGSPFVMPKRRAAPAQLPLINNLRRVRLP